MAVERQTKPGGELTTKDDRVVQAIRSIAGSCGMRHQQPEMLPPRDREDHSTFFRQTLNEVSSSLREKLVHSIQESSSSKERFGLSTQESSSSRYTGELKFKRFPLEKLKFKGKEFVPHVTGTQVQGNVFPLVYRRNSKIPPKGELKFQGKDSPSTQESSSSKEKLVYRIKAELENFPEYRKGQILGKVNSRTQPGASRELMFESACNVRVLSLLFSDSMMIMRIQYK
ncbi:hypothetical protein CEXT_289861 [Caerostris extrusa]|uniref:Uncharacterized protein n=1 Tax=Caerostris extrusa TaxID=172846 RepID=A0AAV4N8R3_CAEEX|nr:hypothetical protein CEXT_289861 [Caerostris extrusa]